MSLLGAIGLIGCAFVGHDWEHVKRTPNYDYYECGSCEMRKKEPR